MFENSFVFEDCRLPSTSNAPNAVLLTFELGVRPKKDETSKQAPTKEAEAKPKEFKVLCGVETI